MLNIEDKKIKALLSDTKQKANDKLKYRIMQQIESEKALSRKVQKSPAFVGSTLSLLGIMYALIVIVGIGTYFYFGKEALNSATTYLPIILIMFIFGLFWMISNFDDRRHSQHKQKK